MKAYARFVLAVSVTLTACSSTVTGTGPSGDGGGGTTGAAATPEQACKDTADAVAKAAQRCGLDYQASYDDFVSGAANGSCSNVTQVRDESTLRNTCIPALEAMSCSDLRAGNLDESCKGQLLRPSSLTPTLTPASFFTGVAR